MDVALMAVGALVYFLGSRNKDYSGEMTGTGKTVRAIGIAVFGLGTFLFLIGLVFGMAGAL